jgi:putative SOS response-associated peptidase YedK
MAPTQTAPTVRLTNSTRDVYTMAWGLIPEWSPEFKMKFSTINARSEGVFESRLYKKPILQRRCIVPVTGFFEWKKEGSAKRPFKIFLKDSPIMPLAGIWTAGVPALRRSNVRSLS